jgi:integrase
MHLEEYKRRRAEGQITEAKRPQETAREQELRLEVGRKVGTARERRARFGWLGRHGIAPKVSPRTINYELRVLFTFFLWAIKRNHLFLNPAATVERFRLPKRALPKFLTTEELKKFFGTCNESEWRLYMSILLSGMRKGEAEHLIWSDISFELGVIFIQEKPEFAWKPKTDERLIPISPILKEILLMQYAKRKSDLLVFANNTGNRDTYMLERLKKLCSRAGIRSSTVHALRHSFGAHLRMAGVSLADIGDLLGHKDLATTQIAAFVDPPVPDPDRDRYGRTFARESPLTQRSVDYLAMEAANRSLGAAGEEFVFRFEVARLVRAGSEHLAGKVERVSETRGDGLGYDVLSFEISGQERLIEVKTTAYGASTPFFVTRNEVAVSRDAREQFHLYRAFSFRRQPRLFSKHGPLEQSFKLEPSQFVATIT